MSCNQHNVKTEITELQKVPKIDTLLFWRMRAYQDSLISRRISLTNMKGKFFERSHFHSLYGVEFCLKQAWKEIKKHDNQTNQKKIE